MSYVFFGEAVHCQNRHILRSILIKVKLHGVIEKYILDDEIVHQLFVGAAIAIKSNNPLKLLLSILSPYKIKVLKADILVIVEADLIGDDRSTCSLPVG